MGTTFICDIRSSFSKQGELFRFGEQLVGAEELARGVGLLAYGQGTGRVENLNIVQQERFEPTTLLAAPETGAQLPHTLVPHTLAVSTGKPIWPGSDNRRYGAVPAFQWDGAGRGPTTTGGGRVRMPDRGHRLPTRAST